MTVADRIRTRLEEALAPSYLDIVDESRQHAGHAGARPGGETHFRLTVVAAAFTGQSRIARQRLIHQILAQELAGPIHALEITAKSPAEQPK